MRTTVKRIISLVLLAVIPFGMSACKSDPSDSPKGEETIEETAAAHQTGAWTIDDTESRAELPEEVENAFEKALEGFTGSSLEPVAYVGSQVVAGMNYMILCRAASVSQEPVPAYKMVVIYADLEGNAEILSLKDFDISKFTEEEGVKEPEALSGGWYAAEDAAGSELPENVREAYEKATETVCWQWGSVDTLAYLGSQVVAGTNYAILCKGELTEDPSAERIFVVTVYEDLEGNASITNSCILDLAEFTE